MGCSSVVNMSVNVSVVCTVMRDHVLRCWAHVCSLHSAIPYCTVLCCHVQSGAQVGVRLTPRLRLSLRLWLRLRGCTVLYYTTSYSTALYCTVLHCDGIGWDGMGWDGMLIWPPQVQRLCL